MKPDFSFQDKLLVLSSPTHITSRDTEIPLEYRHVSKLSISSRRVASKKSKPDGCAMTARSTKPAVQEELLISSDGVKQESSSEKFTSPTNKRVTRSTKMKKESKPYVNQDIRKSDLNRDTADKSEDVVMLVSRSFDEFPASSDRKQGRSSEKLNIPANTARTNRSTRSAKQKDLVTPDKNGSRKKRSISSPTVPDTELIPERKRRTRACSGVIVSKETQGAVLRDGESPQGEKKKAGSTKKPELRSSVLTTA